MTLSLRVCFDTGLWIAWSGRRSVLIFLLVLGASTTNKSTFHKNRGMSFGFLRISLLPR